MNKRIANQLDGETSKRAKITDDVGSSAERRREPTTLHVNLDSDESFSQFATRTLSQGLPERLTGLREAAALSIHAANRIFRAAEEEEQRMFEKNRDADVARAREIQLRFCEAQLNEEKRQRMILNRKIRSLSLMGPAMKKCQQERRDAKTAELGLIKELELVRAELAQTKAKNAELMMAEIARETALANADRQGRNP